MLKGMFCASVPPAMSVELAKLGYSQVQSNIFCHTTQNVFCSTTQAFCGWGGYPASYHLMTFAVTWVVSDLFEFSYHLLGHSDIK